MQSKPWGLLEERRQSILQAGLILSDRPGEFSVAFGEWGSPSPEWSPAGKRQLLSVGSLNGTWPYSGSANRPVLKDESWRTGRSWQELGPGIENSRRCFVLRLIAEEDESYCTHYQPVNFRLPMILSTYHSLAMHAIQA
jgi:hypothetical protein